MNNNVSLEEKRKEEIKNRLEDLRNHQTMWRSAGGAGYRMADQASVEIKQLEEELNFLNQGLTLTEVERKIKIKKLEELKENAFFIKKFLINRSIKVLNKESELQETEENTKTL